MIGLLSAQAVGDQLGLSARKVYELAASRALACYRFGDALRFDQADVDAYKAACRREVAHAPHASLLTPTVPLADADSSLAAYFLAAGLKPRAKPASAKIARPPRKAAACSRSR